MTFFENTKTPKSVADCVEIDATAKELMAWAKWIRKIGAIISVFLLTLGAIACLTSVFLFFEDTDYAMSISVTGVALGACGLIVYATSIAIALHLRSKACMVQNTKVAAMIAVYKTGEELPIQKDFKEESPTLGGQCALCGKKDVPVTRRQIYENVGWGDICHECAEEFDQEHA